MTEGWRQEVDHQATRDAVVFWWEHRHEQRPPLQPGAQVGYLPHRHGPAKMGSRTGSVMQVLPGDMRLVQFGGEQDGSEIVRIVAHAEELLPL